MKNILLLILCCFSVLSYGQQDYGIHGHMKGTKNVFKGDTVEYNVLIDKSYHNVLWTVDSKYFTAIGKDESKYYNSIKLIAKVSTSAAMVKVKVSAKNGNFNPEDNYTDEMNVIINLIPEFTIVPVGGNLECLNNEITYRLDGIIPLPSQILWEEYTNMTFVRELEGNSAVFRATGAGAAILKAVIWYPPSKKYYRQENSSVWIGVPEKPSILGFGSTPKEFVGKTRYTLSANAKGVDLTNGFTYNISGAATISQILTGGQITIETNNVKYDSPFTLEVTARNKCGQSLKYYANGIVKGSGDGDEPPVIEMKGNFSIIDLKNQPEIKSVKVYNLSGVLVHSDNVVNGIFDIKSTSLNEGVYIIEKYDGENRTSEKVILKR